MKTRQIFLQRVVSFGLLAVLYLATSSLHAQSIHGLKWLDENGDGQRDAGEPGLAGVTIYSDLNNNKRLDEGEPRTVSLRDDIITRIDETGFYHLALAKGTHVIREVVPAGFFQTFPAEGGAHDVSLAPGTRVEGIDFGNADDASGQVHGRKWLDRDADGTQDANEPGLPGVTIYVDHNNNGRLDEDEPSTVTMPDDPITDFDEAGLYWLDELPSGRHVIREVVPDGFVQTFPTTIVFPADGDGDEFSSVNPDEIIVPLAAGEVFETQVSWSFEPLCVRPFEVDVVASDADVDFQNLTGVLLNGCGGDVSTFNVRMVGDGSNHVFELQFVDAEFGGVLDVIPITISGSGPTGGAHVVDLEPGDVVEGIDFGNHDVDETGSIHGHKWNDQDGDGRQDPNEPGLPGVTIYVDHNNNGQLDQGEPSTVTMLDDPNTDFDEAGLYWLDELPSGRHVIREVVPDGFVQTFPTFTVIPADGAGNEFSSVNPDEIIVPLAAGEVFETQVSWSFEPLCVRPFEVDVVASDADVDFQNLTGVLLNGCGGDVSTFNVRMVGDGSNHVFELQFVDAEFGGVLDVIPITISGSGPTGGAHVVDLEPGDVVEGIDFGNRLGREPGAIVRLERVDSEIVIEFFAEDGLSYVESTSSDLINWKETGMVVVGRGAVEVRRIPITSRLNSFIRYLKR